MMTHNEKTGTTIWFGPKGVPLPDEVKKKISEALRKNRGEDDIADTGGVLTKEKERRKQRKKQFQVRIKAARNNFNAQLRKIRDLKKGLKGQKGDDVKAKREELKKQIEVLKAQKNEVIDGLRSSKDREKRLETHVRNAIKKIKAQVKQIVDRLRQQIKDERITGKQAKDQISAQIKTNSEKRKVLADKIKAAKGNPALQKQLRAIKDALGDANKSLRADKKTITTATKQKVEPLKGRKKELQRRKKNLADSFKFASSVRVSKRERIFQKAINNFEKSVEAEWKSFYLPAIEKTEADVRDYLLKQYAKAKTGYSNGVLVITRSGNMWLYRETRRGLKKRFSALQKKFEKHAKPLHLSAAKAALRVLVEMESVKEFADLLIDPGQIAAFIGGHLSNMRGFMFNEERQLEESLLDDLTQQTSYTLIIDKTKNWAMNRNITKLSITTHPKALFKNSIFVNSEQQGVAHYKVLVPESRFDDIAPAGVTAGLLYRIFTPHQLNKKGNESNANVVGGMGTHHNDFSYYYPIDEEEYDDELATARQQRKEFLP